MRLQYDTGFSRSKAILVTLQACAKRLCDSNGWCDMIYATQFRERNMTSQKLWWIPVLLLAASMASAQEFRGRVQGVVTDATGALVPGAILTLKNTGTGVESARTSNDQGRYIFDYVDPGTYILSAESKGFKKAIQQI